MRALGYVAAFVVAAIVIPSPASAISVEEEVRVGRAVMAEMRPLGLTAAPSLQEKGERLSQVVERRELPWRFWVIEDWDTYNAFAAPGGMVFITRAYYEKLSEDEAAFVLGHEMAHVDLRHYERNVKRYQEANIGHLLLNILIGGEASSIWHTATDLGATAYLTHYSRALEKEADLAGYQYAEAAGYDARLAVTALAKLGEEPNVHPWIVNLYGTHPLITSREDRLAAIGGEEPEDAQVPPPSAQHKRDVTRGLAPIDPPVSVAVRILDPAGGRWEDPWRKDFTKHLHLRLVPLGLKIAGDDLMYKPDIGDPLEAARSRDAEYLLLVTVHEMSNTETAPAGLAGTPVRAAIEIDAVLTRVEDRSQVWQEHVIDQREGLDVLPVDREILHTDTCLGALAEEVAGQVAIGCAVAVGARPAEAEPVPPDQPLAGASDSSPDVDQEEAEEASQ